MSKSSPYNPGFATPVTHAFVPSCGAIGLAVDTANRSLSIYLYDDKCRPMISELIETLELKEIHDAMPLARSYHRALHVALKAVGALAKTSSDTGAHWHFEIATITPDDEGRSDLFDLLMAFKDRKLMSLSEVLKFGLMTGAVRDMTEK